MLEQLLARGRPGEAVRLAIPAGAIPAGGPHIHVSAAGGGPGGITRRGPFEPRPESATRSTDPFSSQDFVPLPTSQRWLDEERITQGRFTAQRVQRLTFHVVNALIPAAREHERKVKDEDEKAAQEQKEQDEQRLKEAEESMAALRNQTRESSALLAESVPLPHSTGAGTPVGQAGEDVEMADGPSPATLAREEIGNRSIAHAQAERDAEAAAAAAAGGQYSHSCLDSPASDTDAVFRSYAASASAPAAAVEPTAEASSSTSAAIREPLCIDDSKPEKRS